MVLRLAPINISGEKYRNVPKLHIYLYYILIVAQTMSSEKIQIIGNVIEIRRDIYQKLCNIN